MYIRKGNMEKEIIGLLIRIIHICILMEGIRQNCRKKIFRNVPIRSRVIHYMDGYVRTCGITDMKYTWVKLNHLFKDDYIYISYHGKLSEKISEWGYVSVGDYDVCVCGNDIVDIVVAAEKYSGFDTAEVRAEIEKKSVWLRDHEPEYYARAVGEDKDIFEIFREKGFIK